MTTHNLTLALILSAVVSLTATAGTIEIKLSDTDLTFSDPNGAGTPDDGTFTNAGGAFDDLSGIDSFEDGVLLETLDAPADLLELAFSVTGIGEIAVPLPGTSTTVSSTAGGSLEIQVNSSTRLVLDIDEAEFVYSSISFGSFEADILFAGSIGEIQSQGGWPFSADIADPVTVTFSLQGTATESGGFLTEFVGSGTGELRANLVPEPSSVLLMMLGAASALAYRRIR